MHYSDFEEDQIISYYYKPITQYIRIENKKSGEFFSVVVDRCEGGVSRLPGNIEIMFERKSFVGDEKGVNEPMNDVYHPKIEHQLLIGFGSTFLVNLDRIGKRKKKEKNQGRKYSRKVAAELENEILTVATYLKEEDTSKIVKNDGVVKIAGSGISSNLSLRFEYINDRRILIRLTNLSEKKTKIETKEIIDSVRHQKENLILREAKIGRYEQQGKM